MKGLTFKRSAESPIRVYADTSVFGGVYDMEFSTPSMKFFEQVRNRWFHLVLSAIVEDELVNAPAKVRRLYDEISDFAEFSQVSQEAEALQSAYLDAGIVSKNCRLDALHVAIASVSRCSIIVSWNFKHIVNFRRIPLYNGVNMALGWNAISIYSPLEVVADEEKEF